MMDTSSSVIYNKQAIRASTPKIVSKSTMKLVDIYKAMRFEVPEKKELSYYGIKCLICGKTLTDRRLKRLKGHRRICGLENDVLL